MQDLELQNKPLTVAEVRAQVNLIQQVMESVMKNGTHYGTVPGCGDKPTLLKAGAEKIMSTFRMAAEPIITDLSTSDEIRYRISVRMTSASGLFLGAGVGEGSSNEEKYKWRKAVCDEEFNETPEDRRREKWQRYYDKYKKQYVTSKTKQVRTNPADLANTILKMAKKRALVDGILTVTAASDIFTQDIEDLPDEMLNGNSDAQPQVNMKPKVVMPQETQPEQHKEQQPGPVKVMSSIAQQKAIHTLAGKIWGKDEQPLYELLLKTYGVDSTAEITSKQAGEVIENLSKQANGKK